jgi:hypothetical protein
MFFLAYTTSYIFTFLTIFFVLPQNYTVGDLILDIYDTNVTYVSNRIFVLEIMDNTISFQFLFQIVSVAFISNIYYLYFPGNLPF